MQRFENLFAPVVSVALVLSLGALLTFSQELASKQMKYPETLRGPDVDDFFGVKVEDPFRWLEDDVRESDEVSSWVEKQNKVTFELIENLPYRKQIESRLTELWDYEKYGVPFKRCLLYTSPRPRDATLSRMPSSA